MQQKVAIICALSMNTPVVFLDEPTLGLDIESAFGLSSFLSSPEITSNRLIIMTSHDFNFIERTAPADIQAARRSHEKERRYSELRQLFHP